MDLLSTFLEHGLLGALCVGEFLVILHLYRELRTLMAVHSQKAWTQAEQNQKDAADNRALAEKYEAVLAELTARVRAPRK